MKRYIASTALAVAAVVGFQSSVFAATVLTINVPVSLKNIDRAFDSFSVSCQLQWTEQFKNGMQYANMTVYKGKLANRGFSGTVAVITTDTDSAQKAKTAVCGLGLFSSTDPTKGYRPGVDELIGGNHVPDSALPAPGTPLTSIVTVQL